MIKNLQCIACKSTWKLLRHEFHSCLKCYNLLQIPQSKQIVSGKSVSKHQPAKKHLELSCMATEKLLEQVLNNQGSVVVNRKTWSNTPLPPLSPSLHLHIELCLRPAESSSHTYLLAHLWSNDCINSRCLNILHQFVPVPTRGTHHKWQSSTTIELRIPFKRIDQKEKNTRLVKQISNLQASKQTCYTVVNLKAASLCTSESTSTWKHICCAVPNLWEEF